MTQIPCLFFSFFFYHAFIVFRYKKLRAALAMERTKPINPNKQQKKPFLPVHHVCGKYLGRKPIAHRSLRKQKYNETITLKLLLIYPFLGGESLCEGKN